MQGSRPIRVVVADDNPFVLHTLSLLLSEFGLIVAGTVCCGEELIRTVTAIGNIDLVVTDYQMPDINGIEAVGRLDHPTKFLVVSASPMPQELSLDHSEYFLGWISKPFDIHELRAVVNRIHLHGNAAESTRSIAG